MIDKKIIIFSFVILVLFTVLYYTNAKSIKIDSSSENVSTQVDKSAWQTQSVEIGEVTYQITPKNISSTNKIWDFEVILDTHNGNLDQDLISLVSMVDNKSNRFKALKWEGDPPVGHHRKGILKFSSVSPYPENIKLVIKANNSREIV
ncbi:MAG: hypothetical protein Q8P65_01305, partial [bacterium]|nr:hypothetical protein [bacterium]